MRYRYRRIDIDGDENITIDEFTSGGVFERLKRLHLIGRIRQSSLANSLYSLRDMLEQDSTAGGDGGGGGEELDNVNSDIETKVPHSLSSDESPATGADRRRALIRQFALGLPGDWERRLYVKKRHGEILEAARCNDVENVRELLEERVCRQIAHHQEARDGAQERLAQIGDQREMVAEDLAMQVRACGVRAYFLLREYDNHCTTLAGRSLNQPTRLFVCSSLRSRAAFVCAFSRLACIDFELCMHVRVVGRWTSSNSCQVNWRSGAPTARNSATVLLER